MSQDVLPSSGPFDLSRCKIALIGCGNMGTAILSGLIEGGLVKGEQLWGTVSSAESMAKLTIRFPTASITSDNNLKAILWADVVLLCLKPYMINDFLNSHELVPALQGKLLISVVAGITLAQYRDKFPNTFVIRAMPNTPCSVRQGMTVMACNGDPAKASVPFLTVPPEVREFALKLFGSVGRSCFINENQMDAATGLSGCGPAFMCIVMDALADGGLLMGLPRQVALELAAQTMRGTAEMVLQTGRTPAAIKDDVTTPAGCTISGIMTMEEGNIRSVLAKTVQSAAKASCKLGES